MNDTDQEHAEHDSSLEIVDLEPLESANTTDVSRQSLSGHVAKPLSGLQLLRERRKTRLAVTSVVAIVGLVILLGVSGLFSALFAIMTTAQFSHSSSATNNQVNLLLPSRIGQEDGLSCLMDASWSLDSRQVAVLGYATDCPNPNNQHEAGLLNLYNARTTKLIAHLHPDTAIWTSLKKQFAQTQNSLVINYTSVLWSPHGQELAISFSANPYINGKGPNFSGLLLIAQNGKQQVLLHKIEDTILMPSYQMWDMQQGTVSEVPFSVSPQSTSWFPDDYFNVSAALTYHWGANGQLLPDRSTSLKSSTVAIGNPDGDSSFSIWQPGTAEWTVQNGNGPVHLPGVYLWQTYFSAWSPDGRYLADALSTGAILHIPGQKSVGHQALKDLEVDQLSTFQVHNPALIQLLHSLSSATGSPGGNGYNVSWRPDGQVLATDAAGTINLYNCSTGQKLAMLIPQHLYPLNLDGGTGDVLRWSPDGSHLLLASTTWGLSIWGPGQLPK